MEPSLNLCSTKCMMCNQVEPINFPSVLEIQCDVTNGLHLDTRTQLAENLKLIGGQPGLNELLGFFMLNFFIFYYFSAQKINSSNCEKGKLQL